MSECLLWDVRDIFVLDNGHQFKVNGLIKALFDLVHVQPKPECECCPRCLLKELSLSRQIEWGVSRTQMLSRVGRLMVSTDHLPLARPAFGTKKRHSQETEQRHPHIGVSEWTAVVFRC